MWWLALMKDRRVRVCIHMYKHIHVYAYMYTQRIHDVYADTNTICI